MKEVTETELLELVKTTPKLVVDVYADNCGFCKKYDPVLEAAESQLPEHTFVKFNLKDYKNPAIQDAELRKTYKTVGMGKANGTPATLVYEAGAFKHKHHGYLDSVEKVKSLVETGEVKSNEITYVLTGKQAATIQSTLMEMPAKFSHDLLKFMESVLGPQELARQEAAK